MRFRLRRILSRDCRYLCPISTVNASCVLTHDLNALDFVPARRPTQRAFRGVGLAQPRSDARMQPTAQAEGTLVANDARRPPKLSRVST
jgi:hypothetical protein